MERTIMKSCYDPLSTRILKDNTITLTDMTGKLIPRMIEMTAFSTLCIITLSIMPHNIMLFSIMTLRKKLLSITNFIFIITALSTTPLSIIIRKCGTQRIGI